VNINDFPFKGGCLGCFSCAGDGKCVYTDGFDTFLRQEIQSSTAIVYAFTIRDHSMGSRFKLYDDRQFCNGHRTVTIGMPIGYLVSGDYRAETNLQAVIEGRAEVGHNFIAGVAVNSQEISAMSQKIVYADQNKFVMPQNFYGVGGLKIFRDLIYIMRGLMKADHKFYKQHGFYDDLPQRHKGRMLFMKFVGGLMSNKKIKAKIGGNMNDFILMPYKKVLNEVETNKTSK
ncbi:MAG: iron-sulfur protein, partial [Clostridia bacterium]